jgi:sugar lactone lactonase YvrE
VRRIGIVMVTVIAMIGATATAAGAAVQRLISFDASAGELPEGVAVGKRGTIFVTLAPLGKLIAVHRDGSQRTVATLPTGEGPSALGLAVDARDNVYVAVTTGDPATTGVYRVARDGSTTRLPGTGAIALPNALAFDKHGTLYVTDSTAGAVWRIPRGGTAELWLQDPLLEGDGSSPLPFPLGANGIAYRGGVVYVANTELGHVVAIQVGPDGSPQSSRVIAQGPALVGADGLALDVHGRLYVAVAAQSTIVRLHPDGSDVTTIATADDGIDFASSLAFGTAKGEKTLYAVNFAVGPMFGFPPGAGPALLAIDAGLRGPPSP